MEPGQPAACLSLRLSGSPANPRPSTRPAGGSESPTGLAKAARSPGPPAPGLNQVSTTVTQSSFRLGPPGPGPGCRAQSPSRTRKARRESLRDVDYDSHRDGGRLGLTGMIHLKCHGPRHGQLRLSHGHGCRNGRRRRQNRDAAGGKNSDEPRDLFIFFSKR